MLSGEDALQVGEGTHKGAPQVGEDIRKDVRLGPQNESGVSFAENLSKRQEIVMT